jgi:transcriptional regulator with XRE-family HTH domain
MKEIQPHNMNRLNAVTGFLKWYRINSGLSQMELSECSGVHRNTISRYERQSVNLTIQTILQICDSLHVSISEVLHEI